MQPYRHPPLFTRTTLQLFAFSFVLVKSPLTVGTYNFSLVLVFVFSIPYQVAALSVQMVCLFKNQIFFPDRRKKKNKSWQRKNILIWSKIKRSFLHFLIEQLVVNLHRATKA
jgi:hypothetical protein